MKRKVEHTAMSVISNDAKFWGAFIKWMNSYPADKTGAKVTLVAHGEVPKWLQEYCTHKTETSCGQVQPVRG